MQFLEVACTKTAFDSHFVFTNVDCKVPSTSKMKNLKPLPSAGLVADSTKPGEHNSNMNTENCNVKFAYLGYYIFK